MCTSPVQAPPSAPTRRIAAGRSSVRRARWTRDLPTLGSGTGWKLSTGPPGAVAAARAHPGAGHRHGSRQAGGTRPLMRRWPSARRWRWDGRPAQPRCGSGGVVPHRFPMSSVRDWIRQNRLICLPWTGDGPVVYLPYTCAGDMPGSRAPRSPLVLLRARCQADRRRSGVENRGASMVYRSLTSRWAATVSTSAVTSWRKLFWSGDGVTDGIGAARS